MHVIPIVIFVYTSVGNGLAMYTYYENCDPKTAGLVAKYDQTLPLLVVSVFKYLPGVAGLFVASAYSGTLRYIDLNYDKNIF